MKQWNKLLALTLAMVMVLGLSIPALAEEETAQGYTDVPEWAAEYVERVTELKLIDGKTDTAFAPNENVTRSVMVEALYRLAGSPEIPAAAVNPFTDVAEDAACRNAVVWASDKGIVGGTTDTTFTPDAAIERQAMAKMLNRFAADQVGRETLATASDAISAFPDAGKVADWAKDYMNWMVACEFISGSDGKLLPTGTATRAQLAAILCRYLDDNATGTAIHDDPRNGDEIGEKELLVVSFGTSYNDSRVATIGAIEGALEEAFEGWSVRRGFTADIIIDHILRRDGEKIDNVAEALERAKANGVKELLVQPTHLMNGFEYGDLVKELEGCAADFESIKIGAPLLTTDDDFAKVAEAMVSAAAEFTKDGKTAVCYMGHGTEAASNGVYAKMQQVLTDGGHANFFVGTVESEPTAQDLVKAVKAAGYENVVLRPMMIVAGDHANNDMADAGDPESWYSVFTAAGLNVQADVRGLGELKEIQDLLVAHAKAAVELDKTGIDVEPNPENAGSEALADGVYAIEVTCAQSMFKIDSCTLTVKDSKMTADVVLGSESFDRMFAGTAAEAALAESAVNGAAADGKTTFTLPVEALDKALDFAAHSVKKDVWYDRTLTFVSATAQAK